MSATPLRAIPQSQPAQPQRAPSAPPVRVLAKPAASPVAAAVPKRDYGDLVAIFFSWIVPLAITAWGWSYYTKSLGEKLRHPLHALLKPTGTVGLGLGIAALLLFLFMWLYPFRKSVKWLAWTGPLGTWMRVHIVAGLAIPVIAAAHAGWRFDGMIGLGYLSMVVVSLSGIVGRYLYVHIPRKRNGLEMTMEEVSGERKALLTQLAAASGLVPAEVERRLAVDPRPYEGLDPVRTLVRMFQDDLARHKMLRELQRELAKPHANHAGLKGHELRDTMRLAKAELKLSQQVRMLEATRKVFGYWHVAHRPFAVTALIAIVIHVVVAVVVGGVGIPIGR